MSRRPMATLGVLGFILSLSGVAGCAFTTMEPPRQLEADEVLYSGSLDVIGYGPIPEATFSVTQGVGDQGDVRAHVGTTIFTANVGVGGRYYLSDRYTLSLQADAKTLLWDLGVDIGPGSRFERTFLTATPRITTAVKEGEYFYGGLQSNVVTEIRSEQTELLGAVGGIVIGLNLGDWTGANYQVELIGFPLSYQHNEISFFGDLNQAEVLIFPVGCRRIRKLGEVK